MNAFLSPKELALAVGVSESSLKRWVDEGLLPVVRTAGGHRRIALRDALRYIRKTGLPVVRPAALGLVQTQAHGPAADPALVAAITAGDVEAARGLLLGAYLAGRAIAELCDGPLRQALYDVGDLWKKGPAGIYQEHRAVEACVQALNHLRGLLPPPRQPARVALGGALESDPYMVPTLMAAVVLESLGWQATNLGANLPVAALQAAVETQRPQLVWTACSVKPAAEAHGRAFRRAAEEMGKRKIRLVAGGVGWPAEKGEGPARWLGSMVELAAFAEGMKGEG